MYSTRAHSFIDRTTLPSISTRTSLSNIETKQKCTHIPDLELSTSTAAPAAATLTAIRGSR